MAKGEIIGAFCLSEPEAVVTQLQKTAIDKGDYYLLNGTKNWITNGSTASVYLVIAQTNIEKNIKELTFYRRKGYGRRFIGPKKIN